MVSGKVVALKLVMESTASDGPGECVDIMLSKYEADIVEVDIIVEVIIAGLIEDENLAELLDSMMELEVI